MVKTRRLTDLYVRGTEVTVGDDSTDENGEILPPVKVWVQKLNNVENDDAVRRASAVRATHLISKDNRESDEWFRVRGELDEMGAKDLFMELVIREDLVLRRLRVEAELAAEEEWAAEGYLQGLYDEWNDGLGDRYATDPEDETAKKVFAEIKRFQEQIEHIMTGERAALIRDWEEKPRDLLLDKATEAFIRRQAGVKFIEAYEDWQLMYAVREPDDHTKKYFEDVKEVQTLESKVREVLVQAMNKLTVEPIEGKGLAATRPSSLSSDQPERVEMDESSGPETPPQ